MAENYLNFGGRKTIFQTNNDEGEIAISLINI